MSSNMDLSQAGVTKVAFLGPPASYSHQAALKEFPASKAYELEPRTSIKDVFTAVQSHEASFGVVPYENTSHGAVVQTIDLLSDADGMLQDIHICGEIYVDIEHCLLGYESTHQSNEVPSPGCATPTEGSPTPQAPRSCPLTSVSHVKHIYSHPQAIGQSYNFINTYLRNAEIHEISSTSKGAETVAERNDPSMAAIASESAADVFGLKVLARSIQNLHDNVTKFFVIRCGKPSEATSDQTSSHQPQRNESNVWKSMVGITVPHNKIGALADALNVFKLYGLNIKSINNQPSHRRQWHYMFLIEYEGKIGDDGSASAHQVLEELREFTQELRWYGTWESKQKPDPPE